MVLGREPLNEITLGRLPHTPPIPGHGWRKFTFTSESGNTPGDDGGGTNPGNGGSGDSGSDPGNDTTWNAPAMHPGDIGLVSWENDGIPAFLDIPAGFGPQITNNNGVLEFRNDSSGPGPTIASNLNWPDTQGVEWKILFPYDGPYFNMTVQSPDYVFAIYYDGWELKWSYFRGPYETRVTNSADLTNVRGIEQFRIRRSGNSFLGEARTDGGTWGTLFITPVFGNDDDITRGYTETGYDKWYIYPETLSNNDIYYIRGIQVNPATPTGTGIVSVPQ